MITRPITTERLQIRRFTEQDWPAVYAYMSLPDAILYMAKSVMDEEEAQRYIQKQMADDATDYALIRQTDNQLIGHMVFHPWFAPRTYEIGWIVHPDYQRQGYASEAALALLRYGFEEMELHRIIATCQPENPASYGDLFWNYFAVRGIQPDSEKQHIRYLQAHDPTFLADFNRFLAEPNRAEKFQRYVALAERVLAAVGPLWQAGETILNLSGKDRTPAMEEEALDFWAGLIA